jgi:hypothetical protein
VMMVYRKKAASAARTDRTEGEKVISKVRNYEANW